MKGLGYKILAASIGLTVLFGLGWLIAIVTAGPDAGYFTHVPYVLALITSFFIVVGLVLFLVGHFLKR
jgi:hypothetical protein